MFATRDVGQAPAHEALDRDDGVLGVLGLRSQRVGPDLAAAFGQIAHGGRQDDAALLVGQAFGHAVAHGGNERVRRAEVDADGDAALVRVGRGAGFGDLEKSHF